MAIASAQKKEAIKTVKNDKKPCHIDCCSYMKGEADSVVS